MWKNRILSRLTVKNGYLQHYKFNANNRSRTGDGAYSSGFQQTIDPEQ